MEVVTLTGELDLACVGEMQEALSDASVGERPLVCIEGPVRRTVQTTGLLEMLAVTDSRDAALDALALLAPGA